MLDMEDDHLIERLKALCMRFDADPLAGRYKVAEIAGVSEQYLYQILANKPMANGGRRSVGKIVRAKLTARFPNWLDSPQAAKNSQVHEPLPPPYIHPNETTRRIIALLDETDEAGRGMALGAVRQALKDYAATRVNAA